LMQRGFTRLYFNGELITLNSPDDYKRDDFDNVFSLVDRLVIRKEKIDEMHARLVDSIETAFREGFGEAFIYTAEEKPRRMRFSERLECKCTGKSFAQLEPRLFSFNNPYGACPTCHGFGNTIGLDLDRVIPDQTLTLAEGAIEPWSKPRRDWARGSLSAFCKAEKIPMKVPFNQLTEQQRHDIIEGKEDWPGVRGFFAWMETRKYKLHVRVFLARYRGYTICPDCGGGRLRQEAREVRVGNSNLPELCRLSINDAAAFFQTLNPDAERAAIADRILYEIKRRLRFMIDVGLDYLTLDRLASTLSGGEAQRIQLATNLGSSLVGALYVLDEPSIGLHPRDSARLIRLLHNLKNIGNTVLVVEHDPEMMRAADHVIDIGPAAGEHGGQIVYEGSFDDLLESQHSLTARYLRGECQIKGNIKRIKPRRERLRVKRASEHNLKNINVTLPLNMLVGVTGVSGSGKSTLIHDIIYAGLKKQRGEWQDAVGAFESLDGGEYIDDVVMVDQSPIGRTPRSNPVTYIKVYDVIRELFSSTRAAKAQGLSASHFSFNVPGGRCDVCEGAGTVTVEMQFLADVELVCEECKGTRFKRKVMDVLYKGRNIHEVLSMTVREALSFFKDVPKLTNRLRVLDEVGLGYLRLGQSATTLSGGEAQRVKLAAHLGKRTGAKMLYIFDEPTTGLHFDDINKLLAALRALIDAGGSVLVIEHNLDVIKTADYIIDLGPEGGAQGGYVVAKGTPEEIMKTDGSHTGEFLRAHLNREMSFVAA
ncbi:MAG: excinuclease ABC subunit UvrA, partial [Pyrinomonadaceae bacterium]